MDQQPVPAPVERTSWCSLLVEVVCSITSWLPAADRLTLLQVGNRYPFISGLVHRVSMY
jgi:hypothetical protein